MNPVCLSYCPGGRDGLPTSPAQSALSWIHERGPEGVIRPLGQPHGWHKRRLPQRKRTAETGCSVAVVSGNLFAGGKRKL